MCIRDRPRRGDLAQAALMLTAVSALHTSAWIYQNTLPWELSLIHISEPTRPY